MLLCRQWSKEVKGPILANCPVLVQLCPWDVHYTLWWRESPGASRSGAMYPLPYKLDIWDRIGPRWWENPALTFAKWDPFLDSFSEVSRPNFPAPNQLCQQTHTAYCIWGRGSSQETALQWGLYCNGISTGLLAKIGPNQEMNKRVRVIHDLHEVLSLVP